MTSEICNFPQQIQPHPIPLAFYQHKMWSTLCVPRPHMQIDFRHILGRWQRQSIVKGQWTEAQTEVFHATVSQPLPLCHFDFSICNLRFINFTLCSPLLPASSSSRIIYACIIIELLHLICIFFANYIFAYAKHFAAHSNTISRAHLPDSSCNLHFLRFVLPACCRCCCVPPLSSGFFVLIS